MSAKSFHKDLTRTLLKSKMRFLSIMAIIAIGTGFFAGIKATEPNMIMSADRYYQSHHLSDFRLISPLGFRDEDIETVKQLPGIAQVQSGYMLDYFLYSEAGTRFTVRLFSYDPAFNNQPDSLNQPTVIDGRLPETPGEIILEAGNNVPESINLGSEIRLAAPNGDTLDQHLAREHFKVVGRVQSPLYINFERGQTPVGDGNIDFFAYVCKSDFALERFVELYIRTRESPSLTAYSEAYDLHLEPVEQALIKQGQLSLADETSQYREELDAGKKEWERNKNEVEKQLHEAEQALNDAELAISEGELELDEKITHYEAEFARQEAELAAGRDAYNQGLLAYYEGYAQWLEGYNEYQDGRDQLNQARRELDMAKNQLEQAENELALANAQLEEADEQLTVLADSIEGLKQIRDSLPEQDQTLTDEEFQALIQDIRPYSEELADFVSEAFTAQDPGLLQQMRILIESSLISLEETYAEGRAEYLAGRQAYEAGQQRLAVEQQRYDEGNREYEAGLREINEAEADIEAGRVELDEAKAELDQAKIELDEGEAALTAGRTTFDQEIEQARLALAEAKIELDEGRVAFENEKNTALQKISEAEQEIKDSERQILELPEEWIVMTRDHQPGYSDYGEDARRIGLVAAVFPVFFFLVAALVCLTTMTRMVEEERVQIGTLKAMGYSTLSIVSKYLVYALAASLLGSIVGLAAGFQIFPRTIMNAYSLLYYIPEQTAPFHFDLATLSVLLAVATTVLVTLLATLNELKASPAVLMQPRAPKPGKRIMLEYVRPLWHKMSFMQKLTARNLFRYKQRLFMTVIGIAGCTALLLTGFGLKDSINSIIGKQFDDIFIYDGLVMIDPDKDTDKDAFNSLLADHPDIEDWLPVHQESVTAQRYGSSISYEANVLVPETAEALPAFYTIKNRQTEQLLPLTPNGAIISEKLSELLQVKAGDSLTIRDVENRTYTLFVAGIAEHYVTHYIYMSPQYYDQITYRMPEMNSAVFKLQDPDLFDQPAFQEHLMTHPAVLGSMFTLTLADDFARTIRSLDLVVIVLILAAGALAFVVLYNLTSINIAERIREIATIKVLGFRDREVSDYVFRENLLLTIMGTFTGLLLGVVLHRFVMGTMETDALMFGKEIHWLSYILSIVLTMVFSVLVNVFMFYRLRHIHLVESLKAAE